MNVLFGGAFKHHPQRLRIIVYSTFFIDVYSGDIYRVVTLHKVNKPHNFHNILCCFFESFWMDVSTIGQLFRLAFREVLEDLAAFNA